MMDESEATSIMTLLEFPPAASMVPTSAEWFRATPGPWWVLHTRSRHEKVVADELLKKNVPHYLPLMTVPRTYEKCRINVDLPFFPGYMFLSGDHEALDAARRTNRVANVLAVEDQERLRSELARIYLVLESGEKVNLLPELRKGRRCRITGGALEGLEGVIQRRGRHCRMYLAVTILGQSAVVEADGALLEPLD